MSPPLYRVKAELFRTIAHPARIRVLELLSERDHAVHELLAAIEVEASNLSQQLAVLRRAGLITQRRDAGQVLYSVSVPGVRQLLAVAREVLIALAAEQERVAAQLRPAPAIGGPA